MSLQPGDTLLHFEIRGTLGAGAMGEVYRAHDSRLGRDVALKVLPEEAVSDEERLVRFEREAKALAALSHPNIAQVHGIDQVGDTCFIELELVPGEDLAARLAQGALSVSEALELCLQVASGLEAAHEAGVVHRDVKPANIRVTPEGVVKLLDFGLAKASEAAADTELLHTTQRGLVLGTPTYMSPEQLHGAAVDKRTDVWAFACVLYECLVGAPPFTGASFAELAAAIGSGEPDWDALPDGLPAEVPWVLARALEKDPRERLRDIGEARIALRRALTPGDAGRGPLALTTGTEGVRAGEFVLRMDLVRSLESKLPKMLGDALSTLDNGRSSETLVVFLPGLGLDERSLEATLLALPYRTLAVSLYGFGPRARYRPPLSLSDHSRLLAAFLVDAASRIPAKTRVLVGFSAGADQALDLLSGEALPAGSLDGALLLSPSPHEATLGVSMAYAGLTDDPGELVGQLASFSTQSESLAAWLRTHVYLVQAFQKLGSDVEALRSYAAELVHACVDDPSAFFRRFRTASERVRRLGCVYAKEEEATMEYVLAEHLAEDALGPAFREDHMHLADTSHLFLADPEIVRPYLEGLVRELGGS